MITSPHVPSNALTRMTRLTLSSAVLVVEDEPSIRSLYSFFLKRGGIHVFEAEDGVHALEKFSLYPCKVVITGLYMPRLGGIQLSQEIRKIRPDVHIIMVTASATPDNEREAICSGVNEFLSKPLDFLDLVERVYTFLDILPEKLRKTV